MNDVRTMAAAYTAAWCSGEARAVAAHFADTGSLAVNDAAPAVGHAAIADVAAGFFATFPDLHLVMDALHAAGDHAVYAWTLTGTAADTGANVRISGWEQWTLAPDGRIAVSQGYFDADDYARQLAGRG
jgi:ketosteroid isomerase-like protein